MAANKTGALKIGYVAKVCGIGIETIRFYERSGLIAEPPRRESGYREYPYETITRLRFIKRAKELGFSLKEINELLSMRERGEAKCKDIKRQAELKLSDIDLRIKDLQKMKKAILNLKGRCSDGASLKECPILHSLEEQN
jgi:MerR family transcriptional regulator, copper efflux regulator